MRNLEKEQKNMQLPGGFYTDGKKCPTLVRDAVKTKVRIPGRRGKGSYKIVTTVSNKIEIQDHYPVISEPGGNYITHLTPREGNGKEIAAEIVSLVRERPVKLRVLGMDGCSVNCGIHRGVFRCVEIELGEPVQHVVCLLYHIFAICSNLLTVSLLDLTS